MTLSRAFLALSLAIASVGSHAEYLGVYGDRAWDITEIDFTDLIHARLKTLDESGRLAELKEKAIEQAKKSVMRPPALGLRRATQSRVFYWDPTLILEADVRTPEGAIMYPAGTKVNPLHYVDYKKTLLFIDGDDQEQVDYAARYLESSKATVNVVLTGGSHIELMRLWKRVVYFDQQGYMTKKFGIESVPAIATQDGERFRVQEINL